MTDRPGDAPPMAVAGDPSLERVGRLVRAYLGVPVALVSTVHERQAPAGSSPLSQLLNGLVVTSGAPVIVPDVGLDHRLAGTPGRQRVWLAVGQLVTRGAASSADALASLRATAFADDVDLETAAARVLDNAP